MASKSATKNRPPIRNGPCPEWCIVGHDHTIGLHQGDWFKSIESSPNDAGVIKLRYIQFLDDDPTGFTDVEVELFIENHEVWDSGDSALVTMSADSLEQLGQTLIAEAAQIRGSSGTSR